MRRRKPKPVWFSLGDWPEPRIRLALAAWAALGAAMPPARGAEPAEELPLIFKEDFEQGAERWQPTDPKAWRVIETDRGKVYSLFQQSKYQPPHRSPLNFSLAKDAIVGDFLLDAQVRSTVKDYPHRDMCLIFGYHDAGHFYYVHLGKKTDDHANQIFIVNGAARTKISTKTTPGTDWDNRWRHVRLVRRVGDGLIEVFLDDLEHPIMTASDKTFAWGQIGLGSFDDVGDWDDVELRGLRVAKPK